MKFNSFLVGQPTNKKNYQSTLDNLIQMLLKEQRMQRSDLQTVNNKLDKLLVDKHLQMQVDEYFDHDLEDK